MVFMGVSGRVCLVRRVYGLVTDCCSSAGTQFAAVAAAAVL